MWLLLVCVGQFVPEHLLAPAEVELAVQGGVAQSSSTLPPVGKAQAEDYREIDAGVAARVGITTFLTATLSVPLIENDTYRSGLLSNTRFGDPTLGVLIGGKLGPLEVAPFGEIMFPSSGAITLYTSDTPLGLPDRGVVVATGGIAANLGVVLAFRPHFAGGTVETSARGYFRVRSAGASDGGGFDARVRLIFHDRWIVGALLEGQWAFGGDDIPFISPSRIGDGASWFDVGLLLGVRVLPWLDVHAVGEAPLWAQDSGLFAQFALQLWFHFARPAP